jgi:hypothetical protein
MIRTRTEGARPDRAQPEAEVMTRYLITATAAVLLLAGCSRAPNPLPGTTTNVNFCRQGESAMVNQAMNGPFPRHVSQRLSLDVVAAASYWTSFGQMGEASDFQWMVNNDPTFRALVYKLGRDCAVVLGQK